MYRQKYTLLLHCLWLRNKKRVVLVFFFFSFIQIVFNIFRVHHYSPRNLHNLNVTNRLNSTLHTHNIAHVNIEVIFALKLPALNLAQACAGVWCQSLALIKSFASIRNNRNSGGVCDPYAECFFFKLKLNKARNN